jgi:hypothetical protein
VREGDVASEELDARCDEGMDGICDTEVGLAGTACFLMGASWGVEEAAARLGVLEGDEISRV